MGYTTEFEGAFQVTPRLDEETRKYLIKFSETRRMKRNLPKEFGVEGEFFVGGLGFMGQDMDESVIDRNSPPSTQPSLWCQWIPNSEGTAIAWNESEKFYEYIDWIEYLIERILIPRGYSLSGVVHWSGEEYDDLGTIHISHNKVLSDDSGHYKSLLPNSIDFITKED